MVLHFDLGLDLPRDRSDHQLGGQFIQLLCEPGAEDVQVPDHAEQAGPPDQLALEVRGSLGVEQRCVGPQGAAETADPHPGGVNDGLSLA